MPQEELKAPVIADANQPAEEILEGEQPSAVKEEPVKQASIPVVSGKTIGAIALRGEDSSANGISVFGDTAGHEKYDDFRQEGLTATDKSHALDHIVTDHVLAYVPEAEITLEKYDPAKGIGPVKIPTDNFEARAANMGVYAGIKAGESLPQGKIHRYGVAAVTLMGDPKATHNQFDGTTGAYTAADAFKAAERHKIPNVFFNAIKFGTTTNYKLLTDMRVYIPANQVYLIEGLNIPTQTVDKTFSNASYVNDITVGCAKIDPADSMSPLVRVVTPDAGLFKVRNVTPVVTNIAKAAAKVADYLSAMESSARRNYEYEVDKYVLAFMQDSEQALKAAQNVASYPMYFNDKFPNNSLFRSLYNNKGGVAPLSCNNNVGALVKVLKDMSSIDWLGVQSIASITNIKERMLGAILTEGRSKGFPYTTAKFSPFQEGKQNAWFDGIAAANAQCSQPSRVYHTYSDFLYNASELVKRVRSMEEWLRSDQAVKYFGKLLIPAEAIKEIEDNLRRLQTVSPTGASDTVDISEARDVQVLLNFNPNHLIQFKAEVTATTKEFRDDKGNLITVKLIQPDDWSFIFCPACGFVLSELDNTGKVAQTRSTVYDVIPQTLYAWCTALSDKTFVREHFFARNSEIVNFRDWSNSFLCGAYALAAGSYGGTYPDKISLPLSLDINRFSYGAYMLCSALTYAWPETNMRHDGFPLLMANVNDILQKVTGREDVSAMKVVSDILDKLPENQASYKNLHATEGICDPKAYNKRYKECSMHQFALYHSFVLGSSDGYIRSRIASGSGDKACRLIIFSPCVGDSNLENFSRFEPINLDNGWDLTNKRSLLEAMLTKEGTDAQAHFTPVAAESAAGKATNPLLLNAYYNILTKGKWMIPVLFRRKFPDPTAESSKHYTYRPVISESGRKLLGYDGDIFEEVYGHDGFQQNPLCDCYVLVAQANKSVIPDEQNKLHTDRFIGGIMSANLMMCPVWVLPYTQNKSASTPTDMDMPSYAVRQPICALATAPNTIIKTAVAQAAMVGDAFNTSGPGGTIAVDTEITMSAVNLVQSIAQTTIDGRIDEGVFEPSLYGYLRRPLTPAWMRTRVTKSYSVTVSGTTLIYGNGGFHLDLNNKRIQEKGGWLTDAAHPYYQPMLLELPRLARKGDEYEVTDKVNDLTISVDERLEKAFNFDNSILEHKGLVWYTELIQVNPYDTGHVGSYYHNGAADDIPNLTQRCSSLYTHLAIDDPDTDSNEVDFALTISTNRTQKTFVSGIETTEDDYINYISYINNVIPDVLITPLVDDIELWMSDAGNNNFKLKILGEHDAHLNPQAKCAGTYGPVVNVVCEKLLYEAREDAISKRKMSSKIYETFVKESPTHE